MQASASVVRPPLLSTQSVRG